MSWSEIDPHLQRRAKVVLLRLQMLCEGPGSADLALAPPGPRGRIACPSCRGERDRCPRCRGRGTVVGQAQHRSAKAHHDSKPPANTGSLFEEFLPRFARAKSDRQVLELILRAETELLRVKGIYQAEMELPTDDEAAMEKVVAVYEGLSAEEVVRRLASNVSVGWVEKARRSHRRDPKSGLPLLGWRGMSDEDRVKEIRRRRIAGHYRATIAQDFNVSERTIDKYWVESTPSRAAA